MINSFFIKTVNAFSYDDELDSSSDSEDELLERLHRSTSNPLNISRKTSLSKSGVFENKIKSLKNRHKIETIDESTQRIDSSNKSLNERELKSEAKTERISIKKHSRDLISLAEKGRIGKNGSSEGSCSSEAGSAHNEEVRRIKSSLSKDKSKAQHKSNKNNVSNPISFVDEMKSQFNTAFESDAQSSTSQDYSQHFSQQSESHSIPKCGSLEISYAYDAPTKKLMVTVYEAADIPCKERGGANQIHVRVVLLPHKRHKHKTKIKSIGNPVFNETFTFNRISPEEVLALGLRFRVYGTAFARREQMIGKINFVLDL